MISTGSKNFEISEDVAERILSAGASFSSFRFTKSLAETEKAGNHVDKFEIAYNGVDTFSMRRITFLFLMEGYLKYPFERPLATAVFRTNKSLPEKTVRQVISGKAAKAIFWRECLDPHYTREEAEEAMWEHSSPYDRSRRQLHLIPTDYPTVKPGIVYRANCCVSWDMNGAHGLMLSRIFPKSREEVKRIYDLRHQDEAYKQVLNYTVGMFARDGYRDTYNWIVQQVTDMLLDKLREEGDGFPLYVNTDGAVLAYEDNSGKIGTHEFGGWKIEAKGPLYFYQAPEEGGRARYWVMQIGGETKGTLSVSARKGCDLSKGIVPTYLRSLEKLAEVDYYRVSDLKYKRVRIKEFDIHG